MNFSLDTGTGPSKSGDAELNYGMQKQRIGSDSARCRLGNWRLRGVGFVLRQKNPVRSSVYISASLLFVVTAQLFGRQRVRSSCLQPDGREGGNPWDESARGAGKSLSQAPWKRLISLLGVFNVV